MRPVSECETYEDFLRKYFPKEYEKKLADGTLKGGEPMGKKDKGKGSGKGKRGC